MAIKEDIIFNADLDGALKDIGNFAKKSSKSLQGLEKSFNILKATAAAAVAVFAGRELIQGLNAVISKASEKEDTLQKLNTALALAGDYSVAASQDIQKFADEMQRSTKFDGDAIVSQVALAKSFGVTNEQAKELVKAATDLSAVTGDSLDTSVENLGKTLAGTTGLLGKTIPGLKGLSAEALKSGAAIDLIAKRFGGAATAAVQTFSGATAQLGFAFEDLQEELGGTIVKNPQVIAGLQAISQIFNKLTDFISENSEGISGLISEFVKLSAKTLPYVVDAFEILGKTVLGLREIFLNYALAVVSLYKAFYELKAVQALFKVVFTYIRDQLLTTIAILSTLLETLAQLPGAGKYLNPLVDGLDKIGVGLASVEGDQALAGLQSGLDEVGLSLATSLENSDRLFESFTQGAAQARTFAEGLSTSIENAGKNAGDTASLFEKLNQTGSRTSFGDVASAGAKGGSQEEYERTNMRAEEIQKTAAFFGDAIVGAAETAGGLLSGGFVNQFSSFVQQLGQMPQAFLEAIQNLDGIIQGLLETLPKIIDSLIEQAPAIIQRIIEAIPELVDLIIKGLMAIADIIADSAPALFSAILDGITKLVEAVPAIVDKLLQALPAVFKAILQKLPALITAILKAIPQIVRSIAAVLPDLIATIAENIGPVVLALVQGILEAIPEIILVLVDEFLVKGGLFKIIGSIIQAIPQIVIALVQGIVRAAFNSTGALIDFLGGALGKVFSNAIKLPKFDIGLAKDFLSGKLLVDKIRENFGKIKDFLSGKLFADKLKQLFDKFQEQLKTILSGGLAGGKKGGLAGAAAKVGIKFAEGGQAFRVPGGFPNDSFPANLTSGELVVDRSTASKLRTFLDNPSMQGGGGIDYEQLARLIESRPTVVNLQLNEQQLATAVFNARRRGFRI